MTLLAPVASIMAVVALMSRFCNLAWSRLGVPEWHSEHQSANFPVVRALSLTESVRSGAYVYDRLMGDVASQLKQRKVFEGDVLKDFDEARRRRRATRRRGTTDFDYDSP